MVRLLRELPYVMSNVESQESSIFFRQLGEGYPLVLVHELMATGEMSEPVMGAFAERHRVSSRISGDTDGALVSRVPTLWTGCRRPHELRVMESVGHALSGLTRRSWWNRPSSGFRLTGHFWHPPWGRRMIGL